MAISSTPAANSNSNLRRLLAEAGSLPPPSKRDVGAARRLLADLALAIDAASATPADWLAHDRRLLLPATSALLAASSITGAASTITLSVRASEWLAAALIAAYPAARAREGDALRVGWQLLERLSTALPPSNTFRPADSTLLQLAAWLEGGIVAHAAPPPLSVDRTASVAHALRVCAAGGSTGDLPLPGRDTLQAGLHAVAAGLAAAPAPAVTAPSTPTSGWLRAAAAAAAAVNSSQVVAPHLWLAVERHVGGALTASDGQPRRSARDVEAARRIGEGALRGLAGSQLVWAAVAGTWCAAADDPRVLNDAALSSCVALLGAGGYSEPSVWAALLRAIAARPTFPPPLAAAALTAAVSAGVARAAPAAVAVLWGRVVDYASATPPAAAGPAFVTQWASLTAARRWLQLHRLLRAAAEPPEAVTAAYAAAHDSLLRGTLQAPTSAAQAGGMAAAVYERAYAFVHGAGWEEPVRECITPDGVAFDIAWPARRVAVEVAGPVHYLPLPPADAAARLRYTAARLADGGRYDGQAQWEPIGRHTVHLASRNLRTAGGVRTLPRASVTDAMLAAAAVSSTPTPRTRFKAKLAAAMGWRLITVPPLAMDDRIAAALDADPAGALEAAWRAHADAALAAL